MQIYANGNELKYDTLDLKLYSNRLIDMINVHSSDFDINVKIGDMLNILKNNKPYVEMMIIAIEYIESNNKDSKRGIEIVACSIGYELNMISTTSTIQFKKGVDIFTMLSEWGYDATGNNFELKYSNDIIIKVGTNIGKLLSKILFEHGYTIVSDKRYKVNIESISEGSSTHIINNFSDLKYRTNYILDNVSGVCKSDKFGKKWIDITGGITSNSKNIVINFDKELDELKLNKLVAVADDRNIRSKYNLSVTTNDELLIYANDLVTIENQPTYIDNYMFYVVSVHVLEDTTIKLELKVVLNDK